MKLVEGLCKIDSIEIGEVIIDNFNSRVGVKYALTISGTGARTGQGTCVAGWSEETSARIKSLLESVENDLAMTMFTQGPTTDGGAVDHSQQELPLDDGVAGL
jgi:hypothetical protein